MADDPRIKRLDEIADELFAMANEFALEDKPNIAIFLHESVNNIWRAQKSYNGEKQVIPIDFLLRSMGLEIEPTVEKGPNEG